MGTEHCWGFSRSLEWGDVATGVAGVDIAIDGRQEHTGDFNRGVTVYVDRSACLSAAEARRVATALVAAAEEFDRLNGDTYRRTRRHFQHRRGRHHRTDAQMVEEIALSLAIHRRQ